MENNHLKNRSITQKRLRTLAPRAIRVVLRHQASHPSVASVALTVKPAAESYTSMYDDAARHRATQAALMEAARQVLFEVQEHVRTSAAILQNRVPTFNAQELQGSVTEPDQLLSDARKVLELLALSTESVPGVKAVTEALDLAVEKADLAWEAAQVARAETQEHQALVRERAQALNRELVALRRVLRAVIGANHVDSQALRTARARTAREDEDDTTVIEEGALEGTAPSDATVPQALTTPNSIAPVGSASNGTASNGSATSSAGAVPLFAGGPGV